MVPLHQKVVEIVSMIPSGRVVSYGQVALYAGLPRSAREVGWILQSTEKAIPWWRVINNAGIISISGTERREKQRKLLESEGIVVSDEFQVAMNQYRFHPTEEEFKKLPVSEAYIRIVVKTTSLV